MRGGSKPRTIWNMTRRLPRRALILCAGGLLLLSSHMFPAHADPVSPPAAEAWQAPASAGLSSDGSPSMVNVWFESAHSHGPQHSVDSRSKLRMQALDLLAHRPF